MKNEVWKPIWHAQGYEVSSLGRVRNIKTGRVLSGFKANGSRIYPRITLPTKKKDKGVLYKNFLIHRIVAEAFIPNPQGLTQINHINCNKSDSRAENLEWCTPKQNMDHAVDNGLVARGYSHHKARLTHSETLEILRNYQNRKSRSLPTLKQIAAKYGVNEKTIRTALKNKYKINASHTNQASFLPLDNP
jgi:hypothetical protein